MSDPTIQKVIESRKIAWFVIETRNYSARNGFLISRKNEPSGLALQIRDLGKNLREIVLCLRRKKNYKKNLKCEQVTVLPLSHTSLSSRSPSFGLVPRNFLRVMLPKNQVEFITPRETVDLSGPAKQKLELSAWHINRQGKLKRRIWCWKHINIEHCFAGITLAEKWALRVFESML